ncbi:MAG: haloacid dehalogenase-like hydrolase [Acidobacteriota bacterium]|nr:haloacid dehalogenase-like hydrolase [Acidobacteriota bacterium]
MTSAVLFDVDGTLVRLGGAGRAALVRAAADETRLPEERVREVVEAIDFRGTTDTLIVEKIRAGLQLEDDGARLMRRYLERLPATVADRERTILPGVRDLIDTLEGRQPRTVVGLLTGNVRDGARIKLSAFGLGHLADRPGGFGEDGRSRAEIAGVALSRLRSAGVSEGRAVVVGDTEHDVTAARSAGAAAVAVATGWTPRETLEASRPDLLLADLSDPSGLLGLLDRLTTK